MFTRPAVTEVGRRNFERLVSLAASDPADHRAVKMIADCLAGLLAEVVPVHREVLASQITRTGTVIGRVQEWKIPPGLSFEDPAACRKWAAMVFLDSVNQVVDSMGNRHALEERIAWRQRAEQYTQGAEHSRPAR